MIKYVWSVGQRTGSIGPRPSGVASGDRRVRAWDTRVVFIERRELWWWNAWHAATSTELYGFADSREEAIRAMYQAIENVGVSPARDDPRADYP